MRRSLSHVGGEAELAGDRVKAEELEHALDVAPDEKIVNAHVHGFHSWPARLHPLTASRLVAFNCPPDGRVLDPFCGSGTVLVEARLLGRAALGIDINPLAIELARLKTRDTTEAECVALLDAARSVADHAEMRRRAKAGPTRPYDRADRELFDTHVLLELDGLRSGIESLDDEFVRRALFLVLSALLGKLARRGGDTSLHPVEKRIAGGFAIRFFGAKVRDLVERLRQFRERLPPGAPPVKVAVGDARDLGRVRARSIAAVVTSPPYAGVYDYYEHHAPRLRWLELTDGAFERAEIGSRRRLRRLDAVHALERYKLELGACLAEMARVLTRNGVVALVIGDSALGGRAVRAEEVVVELARRGGLELLARASQNRPYFHEPTARAFARRPRREHALLFGKR